MRCFPCHTPNDIDANNPKHQAAIKNMAKFRQQYPGLLQKVEIFKKTPDGTFHLASSGDPISHMGGLKMHKDDQSYKAFVTWIADYSRVVGDHYASVHDLPADNWFASRSILRLAAAPANFQVGQPVQLFVHAFDQQSGRFDSQPIAFTQGTVTPRRMVNGALFLLAPRETKTRSDWDRERARLPGGRYLIRVFLDSKHRLADDATLMLGAGDYVGEMEIARARWREGFRHAETIQGETLSGE
jgi:hypothetical protein